MFWRRSWSFLVTQFIGAFGDNSLKVVVILYLCRGLAKDEQQGLVSLIGAMSIAPFLLLSPHAGRWADRFSKRTVTIYTQVLQVLAIGVCFLGLALPDQIPLFLVLGILLAWSQAAIYSPAKYGILAELVAVEDLTRLNGWVETLTMVAIILGQASAGFMLVRLGLFGAIGIITALDVLAVLFSVLIPTVTAAKNVSSAGNIFVDLWNNVRTLGRDRVLLYTALAISFWFFLGQLINSNVFVFSESDLHLDEEGTSAMLAAVAGGIGLGSLIAGALSWGGIELGLIPIGVLGMGVFSALPMFTARNSTVAGIELFLLGASGGLCLVPLNALYQKRSPDAERGRLIAVLNLISFTGIFVASVSFGAMSAMSPRTIFLAIGISVFVLGVLLIFAMPELLIRLVTYLLTHTFYRPRIIGRERLDVQGGVILVSNHVSFVDALLLMSVVPRPIRFMMDEAYYKHWFFGLFCRSMGAIPIGPGSVRQAIDQAVQLVKQGEVVAIFPEGEMTRTGHLLPFRRGIEKIAEQSGRPILPVHLDRVWGSIFSFKGDKFILKLPVRVPYPVTVTVGALLPPDTSATRLRQRVTELSSEGFAARLDDVRTLPYEFARAARKRFFKFAMADSTGARLRFGQALMKSAAMARFIRRKYPEEMIGLLLPSTVAGAVLNIAVAMARKISVNLNFTASKEAIDSAIQQCRLKTILTSRKFIQKLGWEHRPEFVYLEDVKGEIALGDKLAGFWAIFRPWGRRFDKEAVATIIFSSGSTGEPKGVMLTHNNILANILGCVQVFPISPADRLLGVLPFFHSMGYTVTIWLPVLTGVAAVYHPNPLDAKTVGELVRDHRCTLMMGTPTFLQMYSRRCSKEEFASMKFVIAGAEKLTEPVAKGFEEKFGAAPREGYGCTELSPVVSVNVPDYIERPFRQIGTKIGSVGHPLPGIAAKVVDPDTGQDLSFGEPGMLLIKGWNVMKGYVGRPEETAKVVRDGWYVTGDIAKIDEDGFIFITDRLSRFSKIGGEMVPHLRIEEALEAAAGESAERRFVVMGVPDAAKGERVIVLHVGPQPVDKVLEELRAKLPPLWLPKRDGFFQIESIPILGSGKVDLRKAKAMALERARA